MSITVGVGRWFGSRMLTERPKVDMKIRESMTNMSGINELTATDSSRYARAKEAVGEERLALTPDQVALSSEGLEKARFERILGAVMDAPAVDTDKLAQIKKAIADGSYNPPAMDVAQKVIDEWTFFAGLYGTGGAEHGEA